MNRMISKASAAFVSGGASQFYIYGVWSVAFWDDRTSKYKAYVVDSAAAAPTTTPSSSSHCRSYEE